MTTTTEKTEIEKFNESFSALQRDLLHAVRAMKDRDYQLARDRFHCVANEVQICLDAIELL